MNYHHSFHAGNFADVVKHIILVILIEALQKKPSPLCYLDTHSGPGITDLLAREPQKTKEYENGIGKLLANINTLSVPESVKNYLTIIKQVNSSLEAILGSDLIGSDLKSNIIESLKISGEDYLRYYPGSIVIAANLLKVNAQIIACEKNSAEVKKLKNNLKNLKCIHPKLSTTIAIHEQDGYLGLKAFLPFKEKRGIILIDPPFEKSTEWHDIILQVNEASERFPQGIYAIWYPIKQPRDNQLFIKKLTHTFTEFNSIGKRAHKISILNIECLVDKHFAATLNKAANIDPQKLIGTGMIIINPPWLIEKELQRAIEWVWEQLFSEKGTCSIKWLILSH